MEANQLTEKLRGLGANLVGYADLTALPPDIRKGLPRGISIAVALDPAIVAHIPSGPHMAYYDEYKAVSDKLNEICEAAAALLTQAGYHAFPLSRRFVRQNEDRRTPLPHKTVARLAGIGWIGKSALLVTEKYGAAVRLTSVLTDMALPAGNPAALPGCGGCTACASNCPGGAIRGNMWRLGIDRNELVDPEVCKKTVVGRGEPFRLTEGTCGVCIAVCPYTRRYLAVAGADGQPTDNR